MSPARRIAIHWLLIAGIALATGATARQAIREAAVRADLTVAVSEAKALNRAMRLYRERTGGFPNSYATPSLDRRSLEPLRRRGYYDGYLTAALRDGRIDAYGSPDDRGVNEEFWMEMSLENDPSVRLLVVHSDDAPLSGGRWLDGVYVYRKGVLDKR